MKSIMLSIQPQWVEKIIRKEKDIDIRKTIPNCELPCKVYIYCTKDLSYKVCNHQLEQLNGKVCAEFTLNKIEEFECSSDGFREIVENTNSCLTLAQVYGYANGQTLFGWRIDDLVVYDEPKELRSFKNRKQLLMPPLSWCYCEEYGEYMEKTITMKDIMNGLGIDKDDIVVVQNQALKCNDLYDLVKVDGTYSATIPNLILGMVSGKHQYTIYKPNK